jgi:hypothetical protein
MHIIPFNLFESNGYENILAESRYLSTIKDFLEISSFDGYLNVKHMSDEKFDFYRKCLPLSSETLNHFYGGYTNADIMALDISSFFNCVYVILSFTSAVTNEELKLKFSRLFKLVPNIQIFYIKARPSSEYYNINDRTNIPSNEHFYKFVFLVIDKKKTS